MRTRNVALLASILLLPAGCGGVVDDNGSVAAELTVPSAVTNIVPVDIAQTSDSLYFTANHADLDNFVFTASLYRTAKSGVPGQERVIYSQLSRGLGATSFGKITIADYHGVPSAYFFASVSRPQATYIERVPLDGTAAATVVSNVGTLPSANSPLYCDGTYLFFYGANGVYAAPLDGSAPITVATGTGITALGGFDRAHIYFAVGGYVYRAYKPNYGHLLTSLYTTTNAFTTMYVTAGADNDDSQTTFVAGDGQQVFQWSTSRGMYAAAEFLYGYGVTQGRVQAVSSAATRLLWTLCDVNNVCSVGYKNPNTSFDQYKWVQVQSGARAILGDATQIYFVDSYGLERIPYWL